jgi:hypothetical protein
VECNDESTLKFTLNQTDKVRNVATTDSRRKPLITPLGISVTAVFSPASGNERQSFLWEYEPNRKNYDYIWENGWRLSRLRTYNRGGVLRYSATWTPSTSGEFQIYNATYEEYRAWYDQKWNDGYRLVSLKVLKVPGQQPGYFAVVRPSTASEYQVYSWSYEDFRKRYDELSSQGWTLKSLSFFE